MHGKSGAATQFPINAGIMSRQQSLFDSDAAPWELAAEGRVARVVFSQAPWGPYDYAIPPRWESNVAAGGRVRVPLGGGNRSVIGYVVELRDAAGDRKLKDVAEIIDPAPLLSAAMLELTRWIADHYLCQWGQVLEACLPAGVRSLAGWRQVLLLRPAEGAEHQLEELPAKQAAALRSLIKAHKPLTIGQLAERAGCTAGPINALRDKGLIQAQTETVPQDAPLPAEIEPHRPVELNDDQRQALHAVMSAINSPGPESVLIHGVTGSGKTEVYIRAIEQVVSFGQQAIVLVPEISLTPQTRARFQSRFERVAVLHSHLSPAERHWHWRQIAEGKVQVVVGARSAVFAPTPRLGLIVIDEEHDASFKQDSTPRYHARDVAQRRARLENVTVVLGSATPSLESWRLAQHGQTRLVEMPRRVMNLPLPTVGTIDLRDEFHSRQSRGAVSRRLAQAMTRALDDGGQVILLLNRRGYSTHLQCPACGEVVRCNECDIALTHHREGERAVCHYCDYETLAPTQCPHCQFEGIRYGGLGSQRLEAEVRARFPSVACLRMDSDSMKKPGSHEAALKRFREGDVRILLGTQMIAKGLDFPNVTLVGVVNADTALHLPNFRATERTFQLVTQVAGRTGRGEKGGRVLVQTFSPEHPAIQAAVHHDFLMFAQHELPLRQQFGYPPFGCMARLEVRASRESAADQLAEALGEVVRKNLTDPTARVLGPAPAPVAKLRGKHRRHILLQGADGERLRQAVRAASTVTAADDAEWIVDVDPLDML